MNTVGGVSSQTKEFAVNLALNGAQIAALDAAGKQDLSPDAAALAVAKAVMSAYSVIAGEPESGSTSA